jgi:hypothetical protein
MMIVACGRHTAAFFGVPAEFDRQSHNHALPATGAAQLVVNGPVWERFLVLPDLKIQCFAADVELTRRLARVLLSMAAGTGLWSPKFWS